MILSSLELAKVGTVSYFPEEGLWVATIDWDKNPENK